MSHGAAIRLVLQRQCEWVIDAKRPFSGPEQGLAYLSRYTHRVAIRNSRLVALDDRGVTFRSACASEQARGPAPTAWSTLCGPI